jgi:predicted ATP-dependent serine protease
MLTIAQAAGKTKNGAALLPDLFPALVSDGIRFRRGQVTMIAGQPNSGKSLLALFYALKANVPTLYISADTDAYTTAIRAAAVITGSQVQSVEEAFNSGSGYEFYQDELATLKHLQFSFDPSPTLDDIELSIEAYGESFGEYPHLLIIDNLLNIAALHDNEWTGMRDIAKAMHHIARQTEAAVFMLHHTSEAEGKPELPPSRKSIQGKISQLPEMILTVALDHETSEYRVACVKNRFAKNSPSGTDYTVLYADASRMTLYNDRQGSNNAAFWRQVT